MKRRKRPTKADLEAEAAFQKMQAKWDAVPKFARTSGTKAAAAVVVPPGSVRRVTETVRTSNSMLGVGAVAERQQYTGSAMLGVSQMHKSNAVPVFNHEAVEEIARMRR